MTDPDPLRGSVGSEVVMAYREVTMIEVKEVIRLWLSGVAKKAISRQLGLDRNTIRKYVKIAGKCGLRRQDGVGALTEDRLTQVLVTLKTSPDRQHGGAWDLCVKHREFIEKKLDERIKLSKIRRLLKRSGDDIPYPTIRRFAVAELDFGRGAATIPVADCEPGKEVQLDTGWMCLLEPDASGRRRRFRAWIFTSVCTRHRFVYPTFRETTADAIEACEQAWAFFGGVFHAVIPDNTKAIVKHADPLDPLINRTFLEYAQSRGFVIDPTRARHPKDKARVERSVQTVRDDCFGGEKLRSIEDARRRAREWSLLEYGMRRHTSTGRMPLEHFQADEKPCLKPGPTSAYEVPLWCSPKVARDQHAQVAKALYSLPRRFVGKKLQARADRTSVRFYDGLVLVKVHPRKTHGRSTDVSDFPAERVAYAMRDIAFLESRARGHGENVGRFAHALLEGPLPWTRMRRVYALIRLCDRFGGGRVEEACDRALRSDMLDVRRLERMLKLGRLPEIVATPAPKTIPLCRYLRPSTQYSLRFASGGQDCKDGGNAQ